MAVRCVRRSPDQQVVKTGQKHSSATHSGTAREAIGDVVVADAVVDVVAVVDVSPVGQSRGASSRQSHRRSWPSRRRSHMLRAAKSSVACGAGCGCGTGTGHGAGIGCPDGAAAGAAAFLKTTRDDWSFVA